MTEPATLSEDQAMHESPPTTAPPAAAPSAESGPGVKAGGARWQHARQPFDPREKSPRLAAILSAIPGLGQIYVGYYVRGFTFAASILLLILAANSTPGNIAPAFGFASAFVWVFNVVDAGRMAALYNHAMAGADNFEFPQDFDMPAAGGTMMGGVLLALFGLIALSNTALGMRLDWLETWWPLLPLGLGGYLVMQGLRDRAG